MTEGPGNDLSEAFLMDDIPGASQIGARLHSILLKVASGEHISRLANDFVLSQGHNALDAWINKRIDWDTFRTRAAAERLTRIEQAKVNAAREAIAQAKLVEDRNKAVAAYFAERAADSKFQRQSEAKALRAHFGVGYVEPEYYPRVMSLLRRLADSKRLKGEDVAWLQTEVEDCWTASVQKAWHVCEAEALATQWLKQSDPWDAVNASSHWRKAGEPDKALSLTQAALEKARRNPKIRSALATTMGGALRDLNRLDEAKKVGLTAHQLTPRDFRPCTLLGAVHLQSGDLAIGHEWYVRAEKLGAKKQAVDQDIRALMMRASKAEQERIRLYLLAQDPMRFAWLRSR